MVLESGHHIEKLLGLRWLIRLRWIAAAGQTLVCLVFSIGYGIILPKALLASCIGFIVVSNLVLEYMSRKSGGGSPLVKAVVLSIDVVVLTVMLFFTGGAHNPFTMFYLLHVTMAVILLPAWGAWGTVALCTVGFWTLFYSDHALESSRGGTCCNDMEAHLQGMVAGMVARRTTEVATLAAGIAHELATPLGTIAVVSQDLENLAGTTCGNACCKEDARVIRQEVERCRRIIEKLGKAGQAPDEARKPLDWDNLSESLHGYLPESIRGRLQTHIRPSGKRPLLPTSRLLQSISILIKNAAEASPPGSTVTFEAEIADGKCVFRVKDRGPGFPPEIVGRLGEPLVTTKSRHGGLGLGLYLVKAFIRDQGGDFRVEPGSPTTVSMVLPVDEESS